MIKEGKETKGSLMSGKAVLHLTEEICRYLLRAYHMIFVVCGVALLLWADPEARGVLSYLIISFESEESEQLLRACVMTGLTLDGFAYLLKINTSLELRIMEEYLIKGIVAICLFYLIYIWNVDICPVILIYGAVASHITLSVIRLARRIRDWLKRMKENPRREEE